MKKTRGFEPQHHQITALKTDMSAESKDRFSDAPVSRLIGFRVDQATAQEIDQGMATVRLDVDERFHNPMGRVHGGILSALADAAMGIAFGRTLLAGQDFSTVDLQIQYMRPVKSKELTAKAWVKQRGLRIGFVECEIWDTRDRLIACATCTCTTV
ncbi:MAG: PaaI family thioesterase [Pirellula sp.]